MLLKFLEMLINKQVLIFQILTDLWEWISLFLGSVMLHFFELIQGVLGVWHYVS